MMFKTIKQLLEESNSDKENYHHYGDTYDQWFQPYRDQSEMNLVPIKLLEIGVFQGESLGVWKQYFGISSIIVGIENDFGHLATVYNKLRVALNITIWDGDATKQEVARAIGDLWSFDIIIDDGSHKLQDQVTSLLYFWPYLRTNGSYIIEDVQYEHAELLGSIFKDMEIVRTGHNDDDTLARIVKQ